LAVVAEALDGLGGDDHLDADVADPLGQVDVLERPRPPVEGTSRGGEEVGRARPGAR
jgi:hypothetical protein